MNRFLLLLSGLAVSSAAMADWGTSDADPVKLFPTGTNSYATELKVASDGSSWAMIYHPNLRNASDETDISNVVYEYRLQHFDPAGNPTFPEEGMLLCDYSNWSYTVVNDYLMADSDGNAIVAVSDCRNSENGKRSYTVYKVSPDGTQLWGEDGVPLTDSDSPADFLAYMTMVQLEDGSYVFAWEEIGQDGASHIYMQRLNGDGDPQWDTDMVAMTEEVTGYPYLVNSGDNTCILVYGKTPSIVLYARKIDFEAESVWGKDIRIYRGGFGQTPLQTILGVRPAGNGGVLVSWTDDRNGTNIESPYISYVTADGKLAFAGQSDDGDVKLTYDGWRSFNLSAVPAADGSCFYAVWRTTDNDQKFQGLSMQKISLDGDLLWGDEGLDIEEPRVTSLGYVSLQQCGPDGACAFYEEYRSYFDQQCFAARFDADGNLTWPEGKIALSTPERQASSLASQPYADGSWVYTWTDGGTSAEDKETTYCMGLLNPDGTLGKEGTSVAMETARIDRLSFDGTALHGADGAEVQVYTALGTMVAAYRLTGGSAAVSLPAGLYLATSGDQSVKFAVR